LHGEQSVSRLSMPSSSPYSTIRGQTLRPVVGTLDLLYAGVLPYVVVLQIAFYVGLNASLWIIVVSRLPMPLLVGMERVKQVIAANANEPLPELAADILAAARGFGQQLARSNNPHRALCVTWE